MQGEMPEPIDDPRREDPEEEDSEDERLHQWLLARGCVEIDVPEDDF